MSAPLKFVEVAQQDAPPVPKCEGGHKWALTIEEGQVCLSLADGESCPLYRRYLSFPDQSRETGEVGRARRGES